MFFQHCISSISSLSKDIPWKVKERERLHFYLYNIRSDGGNSLAVQWLGLHASTAGGTGSILGCRTKTPWAVRCSQKKKWWEYHTAKKRRERIEEKETTSVKRYLAKWWLLLLDLTSAKFDTTWLNYIIKITNRVRNSLTWKRSLSPNPTFYTSEAETQKGIGLSIIPSLVTKVGSEFRSIYPDLLCPLQHTFLR